MIPQSKTSNFKHIKLANKHEEEFKRGLELSALAVATYIQYRTYPYRKAFSDDYAKTVLLQTKLKKKMSTLMPKPPNSFLEVTSSTRKS